MNWLLLIALLVLTVCNLKFNNKSLLAPSTIACIVFLFSAVLLVLNQHKWNYELNILTVLVIISSLIVFSIGVNRGGKLQVAKKTEESGDCIIFLKRNVCYLFNLIAFVVLLIYGLHQYKLSLSLGNQGGILGITSTLRAYINTKPEIFQFGIFLNIGISALRAWSLVSLYILINKLVYKQKHLLRYFIPVLFWLIYIFFTTGRSAYIGFVAIAMFDIVLNYSQKHGSIANKRVVVVGLVSLLCVFLLFCVSGLLSGRMQIESLFDTISIYAGSSLVCFDAFIVNGVGPQSLLFAQSTFRGIYNILRYAGIPIPQYSQHLPFVYFNGYSSNIYTSFFPYINDFGFIGLILIEFLLGLLIGYCWKKACLGKGNSVMRFVYGRYFGYALVMFSIAESLSGEIALNSLVELLFTIVLIKCFVKVKPIKKYSSLTKDNAAASSLKVYQKI